MRANFLKCIFSNMVVGEPDTLREDGAVAESKSSGINNHSYGIKTFLRFSFDWQVSKVISVFIKMWKCPEDVTVRTISPFLQSSFPKSFVFNNLER